jgi:hypothetical protein
MPRGVSRYSTLGGLVGNTVRAISPSRSNSRGVCASIRFEMSGIACWTEEMARPTQFEHVASTFGWQRSHPGRKPPDRAGKQLTWTAYLLRGGSRGKHPSLRPPTSRIPGQGQLGGTCHASAGGFCLHERTDRRAVSLRSSGQPAEIGFPQAYPPSDRVAGKQKRPRRTVLNALISLKNSGAGEGIRTLAPKLGKAL